MFVGGLGLWVAAVVVTFVTRNPNLVPTIILLGSFLVPVTFVAYAFGRAGRVVTAQRILTAFVYGGVLGVLGASLLEAEFLTRPSMAGYLGVGLIEEAVKLAALWLLARRLPRYTMGDGIVLGATVGFGFAALESAGCEFNTLFTASGLSSQPGRDRSAPRPARAGRASAVDGDPGWGRCSAHRRAAAGHGRPVRCWAGIW